MKYQLIIVDKEIETKFARSIVDMDFELLVDLLDDAGEFNIQDDNQQTIDVNNEQFLQWIITKRKEVDKLDFYFDQCLYCSIGNPVVMFNDGNFPREIYTSAEKSKTGLMLNVKSDKIDVVRFCHTLLNTENKYQFEINAGIINEYLGSHSKSCSRDEYCQAFDECRKLGLIRQFRGDKD